MSHVLRCLGIRIQSYYTSDLRDYAIVLTLARSSTCIKQKCRSAWQRGGVAGGGVVYGSAHHVNHAATALPIFIESLDGKEHAKAVVQIYKQKEYLSVAGCQKRSNHLSRLYRPQNMLSIATASPSPLVVARVVLSKDFITPRCRMATQ
jgi:hypothetical protein